MATIVPAIGTGLYLEVNGAVLRGASFDRNQACTDLPFPTSGMVSNADGVYETPHAAGLNNTGITVRGPYDRSAPFHAAPYHIRKGVTNAVRLGMSSALISPVATYTVMSTRDMSEVTRLGEWEAVFMPNDDDGIGYFTDNA